MRPTATSTCRQRRLRCVACVDADGVDEEYVGTSYPLGDLQRLRQCAGDRRADDGQGHRDRRSPVGDGARRRPAVGTRAKLDVPLVSRGRGRRHREHLRRLVRASSATSISCRPRAGRGQRAGQRDPLRAAGSQRRAHDARQRGQLRAVLVAPAERRAAIDRIPALRHHRHALCDIYVLRDGRRLVDVVSVDNGEADHDWQGRAFPLDALGDPRVAPSTRASR